MNAFLQELRTLRWDDHRYYHQSRINQSLHLVSAISFVIAYVLLVLDPPMAAIVGWCFSMVTRQAGHFFFEPRGFDEVNQVTDAYKEEVKVGYNMHRKTLLLAVWLMVPPVLWFAPALGGLIAPAQDFMAFVRDVGTAWLALAAAGLVFRVLQLARQDRLRTGLVWLAKILSDPFYDIAQYHKAPLFLLRGQLLDPMPHVRHPG